MPRLPGKFAQPGSDGCLLGQGSLPFDFLPATIPVGSLTELGPLVQPQPAAVRILGLVS